MNRAKIWLVVLGLCLSSNVQAQDVMRAVAGKTYKFEGTDSYETKTVIDGWRGVWAIGVACTVTLKGSETIIFDRDGQGGHGALRMSASYSNVHYEWKQGAPSPYAILAPQRNRYYPEFNSQSVNPPSRELVISVHKRLEIGGTKYSQEFAEQARNQECSDTGEEMHEFIHEWGSPTGDGYIQTRRIYISGPLKGKTEEKKVAVLDRGRMLRRPVCDQSDFVNFLGVGENQCHDRILNANK
jgi:hypothetical protein